MKEKARLEEAHSKDLTLERKKAVKKYILEEVTQKNFLEYWYNFATVFCLFSRAFKLYTCTVEFPDNTSKYLNKSGPSMFDTN